MILYRQFGVEDGVPVFKVLDEDGNVYFHKSNNIRKYLRERYPWSYIPFPIDKDGRVIVD